MLARQIMTSDPFVVTPLEQVARAAEIMRDLDVGAVPVVDNKSDMHLEGIITDRDITVRCTAGKHGPNCLVKAHMSPAPLTTVLPDATDSEILAKMGEMQVRRIPVVDKSGTLMGIVAQADVATKLGPKGPIPVETALELISAPAHAVH